MNALCKKCYEEMKRKLAVLESEKGNRTKQIESCYQLASAVWDDLKVIADNFSFRSVASEIEFYKCLKPSFTSEIEYYRLVYHALLFKPEDDIVLKPFWDRESRRLERFITEHQDFYLYYKSGQVDKDEEYFTRLDEDCVDFSQVRIFDIGSSIVSKKDHLVSMILSLEKYDVYVKEERIMHGYLAKEE